MLTAAGEMRPLEEMETEIIRLAIAHYRGQMSEVARRLQIGRSTLYRKLEGLGLEAESIVGLDTKHQVHAAFEVEPELEQLHLARQHQHP